MDQSPVQGHHVTNGIPTETVLRLQEVELEAVANTTPIILARCSRDLRYLFVNRATAALFGRAPSEVIGKPIVEVMGEKAFAVIEPYVQRVLRGESVEFETEMPYCGIGPRWVHVSYIPERNEHGKVTGWVATVVDMTDRRQADDALRESEQRFRLMADAAPVLIWLSDENKRGVYFNQRWLEFTGRSLEQELGDGWLTSIHPDDRERVGAACLAAFQKWEPFQLEFRMRRADGAYRWILDHGVPRLSEQGRLAGYIGSCIDVTERKQADEALHQRERQQAVVAMLGQLALAGGSLQELLDISVNEIAEVLDVELCKVLELMPGGDQVLLRAGVGWHDGLVGIATISTGHESQAGYTLACNEPVVVHDLQTEKRFSGPRLLIEHKVISGCSCIIPGPGGEPWGVLGAHATSHKRFTPDDVNFLVAIANTLAAAIARAHTERQIRESEERFRLLADCISQFAWIADETGWISWYNRRWFDFTGTTLEQMKGWGWQKVHHPDHVQRVTEKFKHHINAGVEWEDTFPLRGKDGRYRWFLSRARPICDGDGNVVRWFGTNTDITEQRDAEEALRHSEQRYRQLVGLLPVAVYSCEAPTGVITFYNDQAVTLWGRKPRVGDTDERFCGSFRLWRPDGTLLPHDQTPMACALRDGRALRNGHVIIERPDGTRIHVLVNIDPIRDEQGRVVGAINAFHDTTALHRTQQALHESERRLSTLVSNLPGMAYRFRNDEHWTHEFVSDGVVDITGYNRTEFDDCHVSWESLTHPEDRGTVRDAVLQGIREQRPYQMEYRLIHKDGSVRWVWEQGQGVFEDGDEPVALEGFVLDVTQRRLADQALAASQQRLQIAKESAQLGIYDYHVPSGKIEWDARVRELWGVGNEQITYETFLGGLHPDDRGATDAAVKRSIDPAGDGSFYAEYRVIDRIDGTPRWVAASGHTTFRNGVADRLVGSVQDITKRKQAEESRALLATIVESSDDAIVSKTLDGVILSWNPGAERLLGYTAEEAIGQTIDLIIPPSHAPEERAILARLRRGERIPSFDTVRRRKDGRLIDISISIAPIRNRNGEILGASKVARDISKRKEAEDALRESEEQFRRAIEDAPIPVIMHTEDGEVLQVSRSWVELTGFTPEEMSVVPDWLSAAYGHAEDDVRTAVQKAFQSEDPLHDVEFEVTTRGGEQRTWSFSASSPGRLRDGRRFIVGMAEDITDRKEHDQQREILLAELSHRVKNMLATVSSLAGQTIRQSDSLADFSDAFMGRLKALSNVHGMLTRNRLSGADLSSIVTRNIETYCTSNKRFHVSGPRTRIAASDALALSLVFHELTTNAVKYGALSSPDGSIRVQWERTSDDIRVVWSESDGPVVTSPTRDGFGSNLIRQEIEYGLEGTVDFDYRCEGLQCTLQFPLRDSSTPPYH